MPIDWAVSGSSNAMPPGPSEPANIPIARNRSNAGTPNRETLLASTLAIRSTEAMSITIVRFNSIPVCQLAPNFVSPMLLVGTDSSGSADAVTAPFSRPPPRAALPPFSHAISLTQFAFPQLLEPSRPA